MCAAISSMVLTHTPLVAPYNSQHLVTCLGTLYSDIIPENERGPVRNYLNTLINMLWFPIIYVFTMRIRSGGGLQDVTAC